MKIGDINFSEHPVFLAPMEDVTDLPFRLLCKEFGADLVYTEFISSDALIRNIDKSTAKLEISEEERPVAVQIYGRDLDTMVEAAKICEASGPDLLDINFGCPVKKIAGKGAGSGMLRNPDLLLKITRSIVQAVSVPVTVKTRLGWDENNKIIYELSEKLQDCGIAALTIHGRTRSQMYSGRADWDLIGKIKENPKIHIPIIGNGDITSAEKCKEAFDQYGVDAVMIGRATIGCPWIFEECKYYLQNGEIQPKRGFSWYCEILKRQINQSVERLGEKPGILHSRRHLALSPLFKGIPDFKPTKVAMLRAETKDELFTILNSIERGKTL